MVPLANKNITINIPKLDDILSQQMRSEEQRDDEEKLKKNLGKNEENLLSILNLYLTLLNNIYISSIIFNYMICHGHKSFLSLNLWPTTLEIMITL